MPTENFVARVRTELLRVLTRAPASAATSHRPAVRVEFAPQDAMAFVDFENFFQVLKRGFGVEPQAVHMPNLIRDLARANGLMLKGQHYFCGLPDRRRDGARHESRRKRIAWLEKHGATVTALPLTYYSEGGETNLAREKGVDVALASEMLRCVAGGLQKAILITNDRDIGASIASAQRLAADSDRELTLYTVACQLSGPAAAGIGLDGLVGTQKLALSSALLARHLDQKRDGGGNR